MGIKSLQTIIIGGFMCGEIVRVNCGEWFGLACGRALW